MANWDDLEGLLPDNTPEGGHFIVRFVNEGKDVFVDPTGKWWHLTYSIFDPLSVDIVEYDSPFDLNTRYCTYNCSTNMLKRYVDWVVRRKIDDRLGSNLAVRTLSARSPVVPEIQQIPIPNQEITMQKRYIITENGIVQEEYQQTPVSASRADFRNFLDITPEPIFIRGIKEGFAAVVEEGHINYITTVQRLYVNCHWTTTPDLQGMRIAPQDKGYSGELPLIKVAVNLPETYIIVRATNSGYHAPEVYAAIYKNEQLYKLPFNNIFSEGRICMGDDLEGADLTDYSTLFKLLHNNVYNNDIRNLKFEQIFHRQDRVTCDSIFDIDDVELDVFNHPTLCKAVEVYRGA